MNLFNLGLLGLFAGTFLSATLIPFPSEALVVGFYELDYTIAAVLTIATLGNWLGGLTNYWIGYKSAQAAQGSARLKKRFNLTDAKINLWEKRLDKWGVWLGLLSWVPIIGDPMVAVLGFFKVKFWPLVIFMLVGKLGRYMFLLWVYWGFF